MSNYTAQTKPPVIPDLLLKYTNATVACIVFGNGNAETGASHSIKPEDFDAKLGQHYAREQAIQKCYNAFTFTYFEKADVGK